MTKAQRGHATVAPEEGADDLRRDRGATCFAPRGYAAEVLDAWGDPISAGPAFKPDASNTAEEQALQAGMHHDGIEFFPLPRDGSASTHGLLALNHEYTDDGLLHPGGMEPWTAAKVTKSQAAHGVSIVEVRMDGGRWRVVRPSPYARRITATTPIRFTGPVAGHALLRTAADPDGLTVLGAEVRAALATRVIGLHEPVAA